MKKLIRKYPIVSVVLPVYNAERYVEEAVLSVIRQTYSDWELLIADDASTDKSRKLLTKLAAKDKRIKIFANSSNKGIGYTMTRLVMLARGQYVARMDADDVMMPTRLATQIAFLDSHPDVGIIGSYMGEIDAKGSVTAVRRVPTNHTEIVKNLITRQAIQNPTLMFRRSSFSRKDLIFDSSLSPADDLDFLMRAMTRGIVFANIPEYLMLYRAHGANSSLIDIKISFRLTMQIRERIIRLNSLPVGLRARFVLWLQKLVVTSLPNRALYSFYKFWQGSGIKQGYSYPLARRNRAFGVSLVMPVYRGEHLIDESVKRVVSAMQSTGKKFELIAVVDGEVDGTCKQLMKLTINFPMLKVLSYQNNRGKGFAVRAGLNEAKLEYVGYIDAGHDIDANSLISLVSQINDYPRMEVFAADKNHPLSQIINVPWYRKLFSILFALYTRILFGNLGDTQVGLKVFKKDILSSLPWEKARINRFAFDVEMMHALRASKTLIQRVPVTIRRNGEKSTVTWADVGYMVADLAQLRMRTWAKNDNPSRAYKSSIAVSR